MTVDVIATDSSRRPGGGAFYSALQAARLGLRTLILTQGSAPEIEELLGPYSDELELRVIPAPADFPDDKPPAPAPFARQAVPADHG